MAVDKPSIMSKALVPTYAIGPNRYKNIMIGILLGVLLVCGIITTSFLLDDKIKTADDITKYTGLVNLAAIPIEEEQKGGKKHA